jgi:hypothetical protein
MVARGIMQTMPRVRLQATGRGVGASGEPEAFSQMVATEIGHIVPTARPETRVGADDAVTVTVELDRGDQGAVGELLERLLQEPRIASTVMEDETDPDER